jgi:long-chain acyl-CoA synthetase
MSDRLAGALAGLGIRPGDRVALYMPNCPQFVIGFFAILKAGGVVVQTNPMYTERELHHQWSDSGARAVLTVDMLAPRAVGVGQQLGIKHIAAGRLKGDALPEGVLSFEGLVQQGGERPTLQINPREDVAVLQYTGGTTGLAKGAMLTHFNIVANTLQVYKWLGHDTAPGQERILTILPLFHSYGMTVCMTMGIWIAATLIMLPKFDLQEVLQTIKETQPTLFPGVPTMYIAVAMHPEAEKYGINSIRYCNSGSAPLPVEAMKAFEAKTGATIIEGYGLSEASPVTHCNPVTGLRKAGSIGIPVADTECKIVALDDSGREVEPGQEGELWVRGPQVMKGYWNRPEETAKTLVNGWLATGDIVRMDQDGYFYVIDRKKDMIIAGGFNVYPRDVEEVLYQHPAIAEAVVVGIPDAYRGETVKAYVVLKPGESLSADDLVAFCRDRLAAYKVPRLVEFRTALPRTMVGKVLRRALLEEERARSTGA